MNTCIQQPEDKQYRRPLSQRATPFGYDASTRWHSQSLKPTDHKLPACITRSLVVMDESVQRGMEKKCDLCYVIALMSDHGQQKLGWSDIVGFENYEFHWSMMLIGHAGHSSFKNAISWMRRCWYTRLAQSKISTRRWSSLPNTLFEIGQMMCGLGQRVANG